MTQPIRVCVAGVTGSVGRALVSAIGRASDVRLVAGVARSGVGDVIAGAGSDGARIHGTVAEALSVPTDVLIDFTAPEAAKTNVLAALRRRVHAVIGTSGLTDEDYAEIDRVARESGVGALAAGNFSISAVLLLHFATMAARYMPSWEVIDFAKAEKPDAPSGTARELAFRLGSIREPDVSVPINETAGLAEARGATLGRTQIHSIRLPGYVIGAEVLFGGAGERLSLRAEAGASAEPYVEGALLGVRKVRNLVGLVRGLDRVLGLQ